VLVGSANADRLVGGRGDETITGGAGEDVLEGGAGADTLDGGAGFDIASYSGSRDGVQVALDGSLRDGGDAVGDRFTSIEGLEGSQFSDTLIGFGRAAMCCAALAGTTCWSGSAVQTRIDGGAGFDTADYSGSRFGVTVRLDGTASEGGDADGDRLTGIERVVG